MSLWSRITNVFRADRLSREIEEELQSHIEEAIEQGRDPAEARRAFGSVLLHREASRDIRIATWLDSLRADAIFGWRQITKRKTTSAAAILSLALAIGVCTSTFRLIDALLLRPLPIKDPARLYALGLWQIGADGRLQATDDSCSYPMFRQMRDAVKDQAELLAVGYAGQVDVTYGTDDDIEKAYQQFVSGWMFGSFGLRPALGRLFTEDDDLKPGAHPYAVISYDYWTRRFGQDPTVIGRTLRRGNLPLEIVGVVERGFTGTEPGKLVDIFQPAMMNAGVINRKDWTWFRTLVRLNPGVAAEPVRAHLETVYRAFLDEQGASTTDAKRKRLLGDIRNRAVLLEPAAAGFTGLQKAYRRSLLVLGGLVTLILLIACANVANLMTASLASRASELALRVSIGAGRWRLVQLLLVESAWLAILAAAIGALFALWSAPLVVRMITSRNNPVLLDLSADWRLLGFGATLTLTATMLFGLAPAMRASAVDPAHALKGGDKPRARRLMQILLATQAAFCFVVLFTSGLFAWTFYRLASRLARFRHV